MTEDRATRAALARLLGALEQAEYGGVTLPDEMDEAVVSAMDVLAGRCVSCGSDPESVLLRYMQVKYIRHGRRHDGLGGITSVQLEGEAPRVCGCDLDAALAIIARLIERGVVQWRSTLGRFIELTDAERARLIEVYNLESYWPRTNKRFRPEWSDLKRQEQGQQGRGRVQASAS